MISSTCKQVMLFLLMPSWYWETLNVTNLLSLVNLIPLRRNPLARLWISMRHSFQQMKIWARLPSSSRTLILFLVQRCSKVWDMEWSLQLAPIPFMEEQWWVFTPTQKQPPCKLDSTTLPRESPSTVFWPHWSFSSFCSSAIVSILLQEENSTIFLVRKRERSSWTFWLLL